MGVFDFVKSAGRAIGIGDDKETPEEQDRRAREARAASQAARAKAEASAKAATAVVEAKAAEANSATAASEAKAAAKAAAKPAAEPEVSEAILLAKIKASKINVKELSLKIDGEDKVKVYGVVESADDKADLILVVGNTPGVAKVEDAIKVRSANQDKDEENLPQPRFYQVKSGDTLSDIAQRELGNANRYNEIFNANRNILHSADEIDVGQTLRLPAK